MSTKTGTPYVVVRDGRVELRNTNFTGPLHLFAHGAESAIMNGDTIIVTFESGRVAEYRVSSSGSSVIQIKNL